jgi:hypothetical protein
VGEKLLHDHVTALESERGRTKDGPSILELPPVTAPERMKEIVGAMDDAMKSSGTEEEKKVFSL